MSAIELLGVSKVFASGSEDIVIMNDASMQVAPHEHVAIVGPSGSGKTTMAHLISGIDLPTKGKVIVDGYEVSSMSEEQRVSFRRDYVAMIFQDFCLMPGLTVKENIVLGDPKAHRIDEAAKLIEQVGLSDRANIQVQYLSGGEKQRVAIARALIKRPKLLIADEPTAQLDRVTADGIIKLLFSLREFQPITTLMITHDQRVANYCDRSISMESFL